MVGPIDRTSHRAPQHGQEVIEIHRVVSHAAPANGPPRSWRRDPVHTACTGRPPREGLGAWLRRPSRQRPECRSSAGVPQARERPSTRGAKLIRSAGWRLSRAALPANSRRLIVTFRLPRGVEAHLQHLHLLRQVAQSSKHARGSLATQRVRTFSARGSCHS